MNSRSGIFALCLCLLLFYPSHAQERPEPASSQGPNGVATIDFWSDVTNTAGISAVFTSEGVAFGNLDGDKDLDLYVARAGFNFLFRNEGAGAYVDVSAAPINTNLFSNTTIIADYDNDGDLDLYVVNFGAANALFRNEGAGVYVDVTAVSGPVGDTGSTAAAAFGDIDNDGDLDLYLSNFEAANKLFRNEGGGVFVDVTIGPLGDSGQGHGIAFGDLDNDGDLDLYLALNDAANKLLRNEGNGMFVDATAASGALGSTSTGRGVAFGDVDNDGDLDIYLVNDGGANKLFRNEGGGVFVDATSGPLGDSANGRTPIFGDVDNDGDLDLYFTNLNTANKLLRNDGGGVFVDVTSLNAPLGNTGSSRGAAFGDIDNDGDLDLALANEFPDSTRLYRNDFAAAGNHWLHVNLIGVKSNSFGIGARIRVVSGGLSQSREVSSGSEFQAQNSLTAEFGLGAATQVDSIIIRWPSGIVQILTSNPANANSEFPTAAITVDQSIEIVEGPFWTDVSVSAGVADAAAGQGVVFGNLNDDGDLDLYLGNSGSANKLFRNEGSGAFADATGVSGPVGDAGMAQGLASADIDNDGDIDLYLSNGLGANKLFRNEGGGVFVDATGVSGPVGNVEDGRGVAFGDIDNDGDLDLYLSNESAKSVLFRNEGGGVFVDATEASGDEGLRDPSFTAVFGDYDSDRDLDMYQVVVDGANRFFRNEGGGEFVDVTASIGPVGDTDRGVAAVFGDIDNDGDLDLYLVNNGSENKLYRNENGNFFVDVTAVSGPVGDSGRGRGAAFGDVDNDGDLDLYLANFNGSNRFFRNEGSGVFVDATSTNSPLGDTGNGAGVALGDIDADGDLDIYLSNFNEQNKLFRNDGSAAGNHWLHVNLVGVLSNRYGIGAKVFVLAGGVTQTREVSGGSGFFSQNSLTAEFGLGTVTEVERVSVVWPSGIVQFVTSNPATPEGAFSTASISVDQVIEITEDVRWVDIAASAGVDDSGFSYGAAFGDVDGNDDLDIYLANGNQPNMLFRNEGGSVFADATSGPLGDSGSGRSVVFGDVDNDGTLDLYLVNKGQANKLFRNVGSGVFVDATSAPLDDADNGFGAAWGDIDNDGDLDLYLANDGTANKMFRNDGGLVFVDATSGPLGNTDSGSSVTFGDVDNDGDLDLYLANNGQANKLFRNEGGGVFADITSGPLGNSDDGRGVAFGDVDNDGDLDLFLANFLAANKLFRNEGGGVFVDITTLPLGDAGPGIGVAFGDIDNDGDLDLYLTNGVLGSILFRNEGGGVFANANAENTPLGAPVSGNATSFGDIDNDGDLDLYVAEFNQPNKLFRNETAAAGNHWLHVKLEGTLSNRSAIGARVRLSAGGVTQIREVSGGSGYLSQNSLTVEFGLGAVTQVDSLVILWPSGIVQRLVFEPVNPGREFSTAAISVDQVLEIVEMTDAPPQIEVLAPVAQINLTPGETATILWNATDNSAVVNVDINYIPGLRLYGTTTSGPGGASFFFTIDASTGVATFVGAVNFNNVGALTMSPASGILYAAAERPSDDEPVLITIDRATGAGNEIGPTGVASNITDLAFNRASSVLYGHREITSGGSLTNLYTIDIATGAVTLVGGTNQAGVGGGLEFSLPNKLFVALNSLMFGLNTSTGGALSPTPLVFSAPIDNSPRLDALTIHPITGFYYGVATDADSDIRLVKINPGTGTVTNIGATQAGLDGLAFGPAAAITIASGEADDGSYSWTVPDSPGNDRRIQIIARDDGGNTASDMNDGYFNILTTTDVDAALIPSTSFLSAVAPNPFQGETTIRFGLARAGKVSLSVYDVRGRLTRVLLSGEHPAGRGSLNWDGRDHAGTRVGSGNYIIQLKTEHGTYTRRVSLIR